MYSSCSAGVRAAGRGRFLGDDEETPFEVSACSGAGEGSAGSAYRFTSRQCRSTRGQARATRFVAVLTSVESVNTGETVTHRRER